MSELIKYVRACFRVSIWQFVVFHIALAWSFCCEVVGNYLCAMVLVPWWFSCYGDADMVLLLVAHELTVQVFG